MKSFSAIILSSVLGFYGFSPMALAKESRVQGSIQVRGVSPKDFPKFAKLSMQDANKIASSQTSGKIVSTALESEDGYLVYSVEIATPKGVSELVIDAGSGAVLSKSLSDGRSGKEDHEADDD